MYIKQIFILLYFYTLFSLRIYMGTVYTIALVSLLSILNK